MFIFTRARAVIRQWQLGVMPDLPQAETVLRYQIRPCRNAKRKSKFRWGAMSTPNLMGYALPLRTQERTENLRRMHNTHLTHSRLCSDHALAISCQQMAPCLMTFRPTHMAGWGSVLYAPPEGAGLSPDSAWLALPCFTPSCEPAGTGRTPPKQESERGEHPRARKAGRSPRLAPF